MISNDNIVQDNKDTVVVVLARSFGTGISVVRSLGAAGYTVDLISNGSNPDKTGISGSSKYIRNYIEVVAKKTNRYGDLKFLDVLLDYKNADESLRYVLFPTDDYTVSVMDRNRNALKDIFLMPTAGNGDEGCLVELMDKTVQSKLAREAGFEVPKEWLVELDSNCKIPEDMVYPCFCKPVESIMGYKRELVRCSNRKELEAHFQFLRKRLPNRKVLVQEYLNIDQEIDLSGLCDGKRVIIPGVIRKTAISQQERGVTLSGVVEPADYIGDAIEKAEAMLTKMNYVGMFDMEFNRTKNKIYFNELNLRSGGPNYVYFASGVNLPDLFVRKITGGSWQPEEEILKETGKSFVYEKVAWEDYIFGYITRRQLIDHLRKNEIKLLDNVEDPRPGEIYRNTVQKTARRRRLKKKLKPLIDLKKRTIRYIKGYPQEKRSNRRNPNAKNPRIIIVGRNSSTNLTMARSFGEGGYEVEVLRLFVKKLPKNDPMKVFVPDAFSKYIKAYHTCTTYGDNLKAYMKIMSLAYKDRKALLVPADDLSAAIIDEYYSDLKDYFLTQNIGGKSGEVNRLMSKERQNEAAHEAGLPTLGQRLIKTTKGDFEIPNDIEYPCFAKPDVSMLHAKSIMRRSDSKEELYDHIYSISRKRDRAMLVEKYIDIKKEYSLLGVSDGKIAFGPALFTVEEYGKEARKGIAVSGRTLPIDEQSRELQEFVRKLNGFVEKIGFQGLYDIDFVENANGEFFFVELNMRFGASGYAFAQCGINLPRIYADYMIKGKEIQILDLSRCRSLIFVNEKELLHEYYAGITSKADIIRKIESSDVTFIKDGNDRKAYRHFKKILT